MRRHTLKSRGVAPPRSADRRGVALYALVVSVSLLVALVGLAGARLARVHHLTADRAADRVAARRHAQAAVEMGWLHIADNPLWRSELVNGVWELTHVVGKGTYTLEVTDPADGSLADDPADPVLLVGTGVQGRARQKVRVVLEWEVAPLSCLQVAVAVGDRLDFTGGTTRADAPVTCRDHMDASGAVVYPAVESGKKVKGSVYLGTKTENAPPRTLPDRATVFDDYVAGGTPISLSSLPLVSGRRTIQNVVLGPASNPYGSGTTNARGLYVVDCGGVDVRVRNCRVAGTLVLLDAGSQTEVSGSVHFEPAVVGFPSLMVRGDVKLNLLAAPLADGSPSRIGGLVYVSRDAAVQGNTTVDGTLVVDDDLVVSGNLTLNDRSDSRDNPPPGFAVRRFRARPGSWQRDVD